MGKTDRESEDDIRNYLPDLATIIKRADPAVAEQIYREAMDNPELDEALAERRRLLADRSSDQGPEVTPSIVAAPHGVARGDAQPARASAPSPWAKAGTGDTIDKSTLPSASAPRAEAPGVAPPVTSPIREADTAGPKVRRALPRWVLPGILAIALAPLAMWAVVSTLPPRPTVGVPASASPSTQATAPVPSDSGAATAVQSAVPVPRAPTTSATVPAGATGAPSTAPSAPAPREPRPRGFEGSPRVDAGAPPPQKTGEPVEPPPPPAKTAEAVTPHPSATPTTQEPFILHRKEP